MCKLLRSPHRSPGIGVLRFEIEIVIISRGNLRGAFLFLDYPRNLCHDLIQLLLISQLIHDLPHHLLGILISTFPSRCRCRNSRYRDLQRLLPFTEEALEKIDGFVDAL